MDHKCQFKKKSRRKKKSLFLSPIKKFPTWSWQSFSLSQTHPSAMHLPVKQEKVPSGHLEGEMEACRRGVIVKKFLLEQNFATCEGRHRSRLLPLLTM
jgi:hypothetical protein